MSEWQPIETAPKDGSQVLLYGPSKWLSTTATKTHSIGIGWFSTMFGQNKWITGATETPTHWMPLPPPPQYLEKGD